MLTVEALVTAAAEATGLDDIGDPFFMAGLTILVSALEKEARLSEAGRYAAFESIKGKLMNRLWAQAAITKYPAILDEDVTVRAAIVGLPRTGSTVLHRLLACDPGLTACFWWEGLNPAPFPDEEPGDPSGRIEVAKAVIDLMTTTMPELVKTHPMDPMAHDEEIMVMEAGFMSWVPESGFHIPSYGAWMELQDHAPIYEDLKRFLQIMQFYSPERKGRAWVLKTPNHLGFINGLRAVFPAATIITTRRDPRETIPSFCSMVKILTAPFTEHLDTVAIGDHWNEKLSRALGTFERARAAAPDGIFVDVDYMDLVRAPDAALAKLYRSLGWPRSVEAQRAQIDWRDANRQHAQGKHDYTLEEFGLTAEGIARDFRSLMPPPHITE